jgi:hypothetical protein
MKKQGVINSWNPTKNIGTIICRESNPPQRYFLFGSRVVNGPEPTLNARVVFDISERNPLPGRLPVAVRVEIVEGAE